jgi:hypothetical protein
VRDGLGNEANIVSIPNRPKTNSIFSVLLDWNQATEFHPDWAQSDTTDTTERGLRLRNRPGEGKEDASLSPHSPLCLAPPAAPEG